MRTIDKDLTKGNLFKQILLFSLPIIGLNILQNLFNTADTIVLGNFVNEDFATIAVGAVGTTTPLINLILGLFVGISLGSNVVVAKCVGQKDVIKSRKAVSTSIVLCFFASIILLAIGLTFRRKFLVWMNCENQLLDLADKYLFIYLLGTPFILLYNFCASILRAVGETFRPFLYLMIGGALNVIFNIIAITVFNMDVDGVAIATVISNGFCSICCLITLIRSDGFAKVSGRELKINKVEAKEILLIGIPSGLQRVFFSISNVIMQSTINSFGDLVTSGNAVAHSLDLYISEILAAFSVTVMSFIGQNLGAKNFKRIKRSIIVTISTSAVVSFVLGLAMCIFYKPLCLLIRNDQLILPYARLRMQYVAVFFFLGSIQNNLAHCLRAMGKSTTSMFISLFCGCVLRIIWFKLVEVLFPNNLGAVFLCYSVTWAIGSLMFMCVLIPTYKKLKRQTLTEPNIKERI